MDGGLKRKKSAAGSSGSQSSHLRTDELPFQVIFIPMPGDDLQDDFVLDDLVALSDNEDGLESGQDEEPQSQALTSSANERTETEVNSAKRKRRLKEKERRAKVSMHRGAERGV